MMRHPCLSKRLVGMGPGLGAAVWFGVEHMLQVWFGMLHSWGHSPSSHTNCTFSSRRSGFETELTLQFIYLSVYKNV
jgi:hypothetical protein